MTVVQPATATFTCIATGRPRPVITWFFEDSEGNRIEVVAMDCIFSAPINERDFQSSLVVQLTAPVDAGVYVCVSDNIVNSAEASAVLAVHG